jgi:hypothetical protein
MLGDTALGGGAGAAFGAGTPLVAKGLGWGLRNIAAPIWRGIRGGYVKPTPEAQRLIDEGAQLTLGQMDPNSPIGRLEELAAAKFTGSGVAEMRNRGVSTTRDALLKKAAAPGAAPPTGGTAVMSQIDEIGAGFTKAYDEVLDGVRIQPEKYEGAGKWRGFFADASLKGAAKTKGAFELAVEGAKDASPAVKKRALAWLTDKAETVGLRPAKSGKDVGTVDARAVQSLRTKIRTRKRELGDQGDDRELKEIYERAEEFVSELLEGQLPPESAAKLRALDASYRNNLAVERAAAGARAFKEGEGGEFTATQLLEAIRQKGATKEFEALVRDAHRSQAARYTPTGMMGHAMDAVPLAEIGAVPLAYMINRTPLLKSHALKQFITPGIPAKIASGAGRALESAAMSPAATSTATRLYELLNPPEPDDGLALPWVKR